MSERERRGYLVVAADIVDPSGYDVYLERVRGLVQQFSGTVLVGSSSKRRAIEGDWNPDRFFVIEFQTLFAAEAFYFSEAYQQVLPHRLAASHSHALLAEEQFS